MNGRLVLAGIDPAEPFTIPPGSRYPFFAQGQRNMNGRGVQNAQMQGSQNVSEAPTLWWSIFAEGGDGLDGLSRF